MTTTLDEQRTTDHEPLATLQEFCDSRGVRVRVDRAAGVIRGVKLLGLQSRNGRRYLPDALARAAALYEGAKVNVNHPKGHPLSPRDYQDRIGAIRSVAARDDGLFGDLHFNPKHALAEQLLWDAEHAPENVGFSHNVEARTARRGDELVVEAITRVQSVDLVADPATTRGLYEASVSRDGHEIKSLLAAASDGQGEEAMLRRAPRPNSSADLDAVHGAGGGGADLRLGEATLAELRSHRPDLCAELLQEEREQECPSLTSIMQVLAGAGTEGVRAPPCKLGNFTRRSIMERELWTLLYAIVNQLDSKRGSWKFSTGDVLVVFFWAVVHDRPMRWAIDKRNWPDDLRRKIYFPSQSTLSRRMRKHTVQQLMTEAEQTWLAAAVVGCCWIRLLDGKPLAVSGVSKDADAAWGRGAGGKHKGYKLHAIWAAGPLPIAWALAPLNVSEKTIARRLIPTLPGSGYLLGDAEFDSNALYDLAHEAEHQLLVPKRQKHRGLGHRRQSPYRLRSIELMKTPFGKGLFRYRRQIEREFGNLTNFGGGLTCLPAWVRRFPRVRNWVQAKLLVNAARWFRNHPEAPAIA